MELIFLSALSQLVVTLLAIALIYAGWMKCPEAFAAGALAYACVSLLTVLDNPYAKEE